MSENTNTTTKRTSNAYKACFATADGQIVKKDLSRFCLLTSDIFDPDSARMTDYNLGANAVIRHIESQIDRPIDEIGKPEDTISHKSQENTE